MDNNYYQNVRLAKKVMADVCCGIPDDVCAAGDCPFTKDGICMIAEMRRMLSKVLNER